MPAPNPPISSYLAAARSVVISALSAPGSDSLIPAPTAAPRNTYGDPPAAAPPVTFADPPTVAVPPAASASGSSAVDNIHSAADRQDHASRPMMPVPSFFKMIFVVMTGITIGAGVAQIIMAQSWGPNPYGNEQQVFDAMGFAWKTGIGVIFGLVGGKVV